MAQEKRESITLRVAEALPQDVGRGIARISPDIADELNIRTGEIIEIKGSSKRTAAISWRGLLQDASKGLLRLDHHTRINAGCSIDDRVTIKKISVITAKQVVFAPTQKLRIQGAETYLQRRLNGRAITTKDVITVPVGLGRQIYLGVASFQPDAEAAIVDSAITKIIVSENVLEDEISKTAHRVSYEDVGGLNDEIKKIREMIELPLRHPEIFDRLGVQAPSGLLLHGPPGTGKTLLARAVASETNAHFTSISGPEIVSKFYGESESRLREVFEEAHKNAPAIIFIDEIDSIAPSREEATGEVERRIVAQLLSLMDGLDPRGNVVVIGATNRPNAIDPALRRGGRFDREIEIGIPSREERLTILSIHTRGMPLAEDVGIERLSEVTHGFVGSDIQSLCKEAAMRSLRRVLPEINLDVDTIPGEMLDDLYVTMDDFVDALREVEPSALREVFVEMPNIGWSDIGGLEDVKKELQETVEWPLKYGDVFKEMNSAPPKGILLFGSPGTGKTMMAKAVASESESNFISIKGPELLSKWVGQSEKGVREIFRKARQAAPCVVFLDEIDSMAGARSDSSSNSGVTERVVSQLLTEMDGLEELRGVTVIAATNRPDMIDPALLRPGRFDRLIRVGIPDYNSRIEIFKAHLRKTPVGELDFEKLSHESEGMSGADIAATCGEARMVVIREIIVSLEEQEGKETEEDKDDEEEKVQVRNVEMKHLLDALVKVSPKKRQESIKSVVEKPEDSSRDFL